MLLNVEFLKELMEKKGWSERQLAMKSGLSIATISRIMNGKRGAGTRTMVGVRKAFPDAPMDRLFYLPN